MSTPTQPLPILYFDANPLHYYRNQRGRRGRLQVVDDLNAIFERAEQGLIVCITSTFTRLEMLNVAKQAEYARQEIESGRVDFDGISREMRRRPQLDQDRL